jgi:hypothetical protein
MHSIAGLNLKPLSPRRARQSAQCWSPKCDWPRALLHGLVILLFHLRHLLLGSFERNTPCRRQCLCCILTGCVGIWIVANDERTHRISGGIVKRIRIRTERT